MDSALEARMYAPLPLGWHFVRHGKENRREHYGPEILERSLGLAIDDLRPRDAARLGESLAQYFGAGVDVYYNGDLLVRSVRPLRLV
jgi:hypothetical protein